MKILPLGGDGNAILCLKCYFKEMLFRQERNKELGEAEQFDLPAWSELKIHTH